MSMGCDLNLSIEDDGTVTVEGSVKEPTVISIIGQTAYCDKYVRVVFSPEQAASLHQQLGDILKTQETANVGQ